MADEKKPSGPPKLGSIEEFLTVASFKAGDKDVPAPVKGSVNVIIMMKGITFHGDKDKTILHLEKAYPDCKFRWPE